MSDATRGPNGNGLTLAVPGGSLQVTGRDVVMAVLIILVGILVYRGFEANAQQHATLTHTFDRLGCLLSLDMPERLEALQSGDPCHYALTVRRGGRPR